jgi:hypothetical protein
VSKIQTMCHGCGVVVISAGAVDLIVWSDQEAIPSHVTFRCPSCSLRTVTLVAVDQVERLASLGARVRRYGVLPGRPGVPPRPQSPESRPPPGVPPISHDDLIEFHRFLERSDWWERLLELERRG